MHLASRGASSRLTVAIAASVASRMDAWTNESNQSRSTTTLREIFPSNPEVRLTAAGTLDAVRAKSVGGPASASISVWTNPGSANGASQHAAASAP
jgi:hypothetical protein